MPCIFKLSQTGLLSRRENLEQEGFGKFVFNNAPHVMGLLMIITVIEYLLRVMSYAVLFTFDISFNLQIFVR